jgi:ribonuclease P protein component
LETGRRRGSRYLEFFWTDNSEGHPRVGLVVPRFRSSAVARNRLRRRLREVWRREVGAAQSARDLVIRARREAYRASFGALRGEILLWRDTVTSP